MNRRARPRCPRTRRASNEEFTLNQQRASHSQLENLNNSNLTLADESEDIRGRHVTDRDGAHIGHVSGLFIDTDESKVRMLEVRAGGFLGFGDRHVLIPVGAVISVAKNDVRVNQSREHVMNSPAYDPKLAALPGDASWDSFSGYYGLPASPVGSLGPSVPLSPEELRILHTHSSMHGPGR